MIKQTLKNSLPVAVFFAIVLAFVLLLYALVPSDPDLRPRRPTETPEGYSYPGCDCSADVYDCEDFPNYATAQPCYDYCLQKVGADVHHLDENQNGVVCAPVP